MAGDDSDAIGEAQLRPVWPWILVAFVAGLAARQFGPLAANFFRSSPPTPAASVTQSQDRPQPRVNLDAELTGDAAPVLVRFSLDNSYPDSEATLREAALRILPARDVTIAGPTAIPDLIRQQFAIASDQQPLAYAQIEAVVRRRSEIVNGLVTVARVPQLSPHTTRRNNLSAFITLRVGGNENQPLVPLLPNGEPFRPGGSTQPSFTTYTVSGTEGDLNQGPLRVLAHSQRGEILAKQIEIQLAAETPALAPPYPPFVLAEATRVKGIVGTGTRHVKLYVLDTGWPDDTTRRRSIDVLTSLCVGARKWYNFPAGPSPIIDPATAFAGPLDTHVVGVKASLDQTATTPNAVDIVYVPMTYDQQSKPLLTEIVTLGLAVKKWGRPDVPPERRDGPKEFAAVTPADIAAAMKTISDAPAGGKFHINSALLNGIFLIAMRDAAATGNGYFVNESWTTVDRDILDAPVESPRGFVVAAVGNEDPRNISNAKVAFASFARQHKNILAVLTMNAQGIVDCKSSTVTFAQRDSGAVGYFGQVSQHACYSSFAAPRVAWFLAARDTLRSASIASPDDWVDDIRARINDLRASTDPIPQSFLFNPVKYLQ